MRPVFRLQLESLSQTNKQNTGIKRKVETGVELAETESRGGKATALTGRCQCLRVAAAAGFTKEVGFWLGEKDKLDRESQKGEE